MSENLKNKAVIMFAALGFLVVPAFTSASYDSYYDGDGGFISGGPVGNPCFVRIYHTNFEFPPEGGQIVKIGDAMYFNQTYLPGCGGSYPQPVYQPVYQPSYNYNNYNQNYSYRNVPVYTPPIQHYCY